MSPPAFLAPLLADGSIPTLLIAVAVGYLLGSIPFGLVLTRLAGLGDVRKIGSGNIGATNVLRTGNKKLAALTLLLDGLKGTVAVLIAERIGAAGGVAILASLIGGLAAFLGHLFPAWLGFKGGKGVATYIGVLFGLMVHAGLAFCAVWLAVAFATRYSSLAAIVASIVLPVGLWFAGEPAIALAATLMSALLLWKHAANIRRLSAGEEPKIGAKT
ncbi:MAG: glycerol-3-phosphate 1-O-acyltransferase PlsY [Hyphomicrobium sp.]